MPSLVTVKVSKILKPDSFNNKFIAAVREVDGKSTRGKVLVSIRKDSTLSTINVDDNLLISSQVLNIPPPLNPYQFNYAKYLHTLNIYHQIHISKFELLDQCSGAVTVIGRAEKIRNYFIQKLKNSSIKTDERSIIQALILGNRKDISTQLNKDFAAAGAIHILAVSGLHVGIIYFILIYLLSPLKVFPHSRAIQSLLIVLGLWIFAFITGLSPSVVRAVTMFSFFALAKSLNRPTNSMNTLFISFFVLLLIHPLWLFNVGFQMSYLAVFFILWIQRDLFMLYLPENRLLKKIWGIFTVTIAAQLGVFPLSLYYFHQFPGLFFATNIVVLPFLGILLTGGLLVVLLAGLNILPEGMAAGYNFLIESLINFISWIAKQEYLIFKDIPFSLTKVLASYLLIILLILLWKKFNFNRLVYFLSGIAFLIGVLILDEYRALGHQLVIFHKYKNTLVTYKRSKDLIVYLGDSNSVKKNITYFDDFPIRSYRIGQKIKNYEVSVLPTVFSYKEKRILVIDSLGTHPTNSKNIDMILLTYSPKINLERLLDSLKPELIIANGTNYSSYISRWRKTCRIKNTPFHNTDSKGALVIND